MSRAASPTRTATCGIDDARARLAALEVAGVARPISGTTPTARAR